MELNWQTIFDKMAKTAVRAEELGLIELADILSSAFDEMESMYNSHSNDSTIILICSQFSERAARRVEIMGEWIRKNRITKTQTQYIVTNYDYKMFYWAKRRGFDSEIDNLQIKINIDALSGKERASFESRITVDKK